MAGGVGTRFWPSSTVDRPKQFLDILGIGKSLLRMTYERFIRIVPAEHIYIMTNNQYFELVSSELPELPISNILLEPSRNNTAPCIAYAALRLKVTNPDAVFVTAPSDHVILKEEAFLAHITVALGMVREEKKIVTLGIQPTRPDTGYGYINVANNTVIGQSQKVVSFKEKPDLETAEQYVASGHYLWNGGIFIWKADTLLEEFAKYAPSIVDILTQDISQIGSDTEQAYIDKVYPDTPKISVDYAILEKSTLVHTIPVDIGWSDLGTWNSLYEYMEKDNNNTVNIGENTFLLDTQNCIIRSDSKKIVVVKGLKDYIIVDEDDALLIYPKGEEQDIKRIVQDLIG